MKYLLVEFRDNWEEDEINIEGFFVCREDFWETFITNIQRIDFPISIKIGITGKLKYSNFKELLSYYKQTEISKELYGNIIKHFNLSNSPFPSFGEIGYVKYFGNYLSSEEIVLYLK